MALGRVKNAIQRKIRGNLSELPRGLHTKPVGMVLCPSTADDVISRQSVNQRVERAYVIGFVGKISSQMCIRKYGASARKYKYFMSKTLLIDKDRDFRTTLGYGHSALCYPS